MHNEGGNANDKGILSVLVFPLTYFLGGKLFIYHVLFKGYHFFSESAVSKVWIINE
jgi:hypothetical protein